MEQPIACGIPQKEGRGPKTPRFDVGERKASHVPPGDGIWAFKALHLDGSVAIKPLEGS